MDFWRNKPCGMLGEHAKSLWKLLGRNAWQTYERLCGSCEGVKLVGIMNFSVSNLGIMNHEIIIVKIRGRWLKPHFKLACIWQAKPYLVSSLPPLKLTYLLLIIHESTERQVIWYYRCIAQNCIVRQPHIHVICERPVLQLLLNIDLFRDLWSWENIRRRIFFSVIWSVIQSVIQSVILSVIQSMIWTMIIMRTFTTMKLDWNKHLQTLKSYFTISS